MSNWPVTGSRSLKSEQTRIYWIDVLKYIGMICIYLGHFGEAAGMSYLFMFKFHVPLFFFLSGCTESLNRETSIRKNIWKRVKSLLIPFYVFAVLSIIVRVLIENNGLHSVWEDLILVAKGCVRNKFFAGSLWFLTALFSICVIFTFLKKIKYKSVIITISVLAHLFIYVVQRLPWLDRMPHPSTWWFNLGYALQSLVYYAIGYVVFPSLNQWFSGGKAIYKVTVSVTCLITGIFTALVFFGHNILIFANSISLLRPFVIPVTALIIILFFTIIAHYFENVRYLCRVGQNTLYLAGGEYLVKRSVLAIIEMLGLPFSYPNPLSVYLYTFFLLWLADKFLVPAEKKVLEAVNCFIGLRSGHKNLLDKKQDIQ